MGRSILAVLVGFIVANLVILAIEVASHAVYPPPAGLDPSDRAALRAIIEKMPTGAFVLLLLAGVVGTAVGAGIAARIARRARVVHGLIVGGVIMVGAIANAFLIPHPRWFQFASPASIVPAAYLGAWLANGGRESADGRGAEPEAA